MSDDMNDAKNPETVPEQIHKSEGEGSAGCPQAAEACNPPPDETPRQRSMRLREEAIEAEDGKLLAEMAVGATRVLKRDGAGRISARKVLDETTGESAIVRFAEYGENPFKPVYCLVGADKVEAMPVPGGVLLAVNGIPAMVPGAVLVEDAENAGHFKIA